MYTLLVVVLLIVGVLLLLAEVFLLPGIGAAGLFGVVCLVGATISAYFWISPLAGHITLAASVLLTAILVYVFFRFRLLDKMSLKTDIDSKVDLLSDLGISTGDHGVCVGRLAPMGKVMINDKIVEAKSNLGFVDEGKEIEVISIEGNHVVVKEI